ncbi:MAG: hypothetical protein AABX13_01545 [Nanoarchaeota archaeon]
MNEIKDLSNIKSVKVHCDFCSKEMECPETMLKAKKQMCFECFNNGNYPDQELKDVHVDMPMTEIKDKVCSEMADRMIDNVFPEMWQNKKEELKDMSKKNLAEEMFGAGVYLGVKAFLETLKEAEKEEENSSKNVKMGM